VDLISGKPFWPWRNGDLPRYPRLGAHVSCDVAVIGGGYSGALIAHTLSRIGRDVVVVDRRDIGRGSTAASTALIEYQLDAELREFIDLAGTRAAVRAYRLSRDAVAGLEDVVRRLDDRCGWARKVGLHLASGPAAVAALREEVRTRARYGFQVAMLSRDELRSEFEIDAPAALRYPEAAQVDPFRFTHALIRGSRNVRAFGRTEVRRFTCGRRSVTLEVARGHRITAGSVVFATGYESLSYLRRGLAKLVSTFALVSRPRDRWPRGIEECIFTETADPYLYARSTADGRVMMGGEDEPLTTEAARARRIRSKKRALLAKFDRWFPGLEPAVSRSWAGAFAVTRDGLGYVDQSKDYPNAWFLVGAGGNGMIFSVIAAQILEDAYRGRANRDAHLFRFDRRRAR
jgi:glycine/D-amino acid oxidase-like deaminating enzyme